jgi:hypothetical protein
MSTPLIGRRGLFAGAGAVTLGAVAGSAQAGATTAIDGPNDGAPTSGSPARSDVAEAFPASDPTLEYMSVHPADWRPYYAPTLLNHVPGGGLTASSSNPFVRMPIHLPHGSIVKRVELPIEPKSSGPTVQLTRYDGSTKAYLDVAGPVTVAGNTFTVAVLAADVVIDNLAFSYEIQLILNTAEVWAGRIAYVPPTRPFRSINPARVYDSRKGGGVLAPNTSRVIAVKDGLDQTGAVSTPNVVPIGATAIAYNVTVTGNTAPNFLSVTPGDTASALASTINFPGRIDLANASVVGIDSNRQVKVFCGDQAGSTHVIIDVVGYYL